MIAVSNQLESVFVFEEGFRSSIYKIEINKDLGLHLCITTSKSRSKAGRRCFLVVHRLHRRSDEDRQGISFAEINRHFMVICKSLWLLQVQTEFELTGDSNHVSRTAAVYGLARSPESINLANVYDESSVLSADRGHARIN